MTFKNPKSLPHVLQRLDGLHLLISNLFLSKGYFLDLKEKSSILQHQNIRLSFCLSIQNLLPESELPVKCRKNRNVRF